LYLAKFQLTPEESDNLPVDVDTWLLPVFLTIQRIEGGE